jgi:hypothetical protein
MSTLEATYYTFDSCEVEYVIASLKRSDNGSLLENGDNRLEFFCVGYFIVVSLPQTTEH